MNHSLQVKKAVIPTAGMGTRFLPASKTIPKELFPIIDRPILLFIIEEAVRSGIEDIVLVTGRGKTAIDDFFDTSFELEAHLEKMGQVHRLEEIQKIKSLAHIITVRQQVAKGLGHAIGVSYPVIGDSPFAVLLGDELMITPDHQTPVTGQLMKHFIETGISTVAIMEVPSHEVCNYGIASGSFVREGLMRVEHLVEKPAINKSPSNWALPGRYVFTSQIFTYLSQLSPGSKGEIQLTDGMREMARSQGLYGATFKSRRYDAGNKLGYLQANVEQGLEHPDIGQEFKKYLVRLVSDFS